MLLNCFYREIEMCNCMKTRIAIATVSGRTYYELVKELQKKNLPFLSLRPWDPVPLYIRVVISTREEKTRISHPQILVFEEGSNPESIVDKAILIIQGKKGYEKLIVGVDPGKTYAIAVLGDKRVLGTLTCSDIEKTTHLIFDNLMRFPADIRLVRVGNGPSDYTKNLLISLDKILPKEIDIEIVGEEGTSRIKRKSMNRRVLRDTLSAIKIAGRSGWIYSRVNIQ